MYGQYLIKYIFSFLLTYIHSSQHGTLFPKALINLGLHGNADDYRYLSYNTRLSGLGTLFELLCLHSVLMYNTEEKLYNVM